MTLTYNKDGKLEFDLYSLLQCVSKESRVELIESLSCDEAVIQHVTDQILGGWTEHCFCGAMECGASPSPYNSLDKARREISKRSSEIAKEEIEKLEKALKQTNDELQKLREEIYCANHRI